MALPGLVAAKNLADVVDRERAWDNLGVNISATFATVSPVSYGASAAYSLRDLTGQNPRVVRVRRSSDNAELDFTASEITSGFLTSWVGSGNDGFARTWYNQAADIYHLEQSIISRQATIVTAASGLLVTNGKPTIRFGGAIGSMFGYTPAFGDVSIFVVFNCTNIATANHIFGTQSWTTVTNGNWLVDVNGNAFGLRTDPNNTLTTVPIQQNKQYIGSTFQVNSMTRAFVNNTPGSTNSGAARSWAGPGRLSDVSNDRGFKGDIQEIVFYEKNVEGNRALIEAEMNSYYKTF
jgi:hypothetical protein